MPYHGHMAESPGAADPLLPPRPLPATYWVVPGRFLVGEHPGSQSRAEAMDRLRRFPDFGVTCFVELTEPGELPSYESLPPYMTPDGRRVAIARLLTQNPSVFLLDEPVNHLDPRHQVATLKIFRERADSGAAILMSLHDAALAMRHADRALLLHMDGSWQLGEASSVLTATNLERLFNTHYQRFDGPDSASVLLPG